MLIKDVLLRSKLLVGSILSLFVPAASYAEALDCNNGHPVDRLICDNLVDGYSHLTIDPFSVAGPSTWFYYRDGQLWATGDGVWGSFRQQFRKQDGCWRKIGLENTWFPHGDEPIQRSVNYLTGEKILRYNYKPEELSTFEITVECFYDSYLELFVFDHAIPQIN